jgi:transcriptional regulator with GAF, ATPase, and Fis domain
VRNSSDRTRNRRFALGTGKELIAHAIHHASQRCGSPFIKLNCAPIPLDLPENELFGHEKGAFTGAIAQKIGRFEMADKGTLFSDEVGDIPSALQPKMLRVLQEQEFERLGSGRPHQVDLRLVAATNRHLVKMVARGQFRSDLYYRLNVFPILLPSLRERRGGHSRACHTIREVLQPPPAKTGRLNSSGKPCLPSSGIPGPATSASCRTWRNVPLSFRGTACSRTPLRKKGEQRICSRTQHRFSPSSMAFEDSDRALIVETLEHVGWIVGGPRGAAAKLGLKTNYTACQNEKIGNHATYLSGTNRCSRSRARRCPDLRVELAAAHGIKLVSKRERLERQTVIDPILALFA